ncbi:sodium-dependent transporter [Pontibacter sp. G13]|uniref:sodium-dependent transporter n=1 Tax=Pontibacter sp. G13 TaxID=3074898 RepID=UPI00288AB79B|nr:sodium-dependent transporter [Pontibacter sp. G13]WNJ20771.1 sodium-dependent transporter [Pontibacter sp. G13]
MATVQKPNTSKGTRSGFSSRLGFIAAAAGSAVGLGNIWRFPAETGANGGAAFLVIYLLCTVLIGFPIMVGEITLGRRAQSDPFGAYSKVGKGGWGIVGLLGVLCGIMILSFYNVVAGWAFGYFLQISFGDLLAQPDFGAYFGQFAAGWYENHIFWYALAFMAITAFVVLKGIKDGIETIAKVLMPALFLLLVGLIIYALTLDGAGDGLAYYLLPDFSKVTPKTFYTAMGQAFFSLSLGMGALITYGSYISKKENIISSAAIVTIADISVAFLAGLLIFPLVFSQGQAPSGGPGLVFVALPGIFQSMGPILGRIVGGGFFLLLCVAALTSTISLLEVPASHLIDERKVPRKFAVIGLSVVIFILGIPSMLSAGGSEFFTQMLVYENGSDKSFLDLINDVFSDTFLPLGGLILSLFLAYRWNLADMAKEIEQGNEGYIGSALNKYLDISIRFICPIILGGITLVTILEKFLSIQIFG